MCGSKRRRAPLAFANMAPGSRPCGYGYGFGGGCGYGRAYRCSTAARPPQQPHFGLGGGLGGGPAGLVGMAVNAIGNAVDSRYQHQNKSTSIKGPEQAINTIGDVLDFRHPNHNVTKSNESQTQPSPNDSEGVERVRAELEKYALEQHSRPILPGEQPPAYPGDAGLPISSLVTGLLPTTLAKYAFPTTVNPEHIASYPEPFDAIVEEDIIALNKGLEAYRRGRFAAKLQTCAARDKLMADLYSAEVTMRAGMWGAKERKLVNAQLKAIRIEIKNEMRMIKRSR